MAVTDLALVVPPFLVGGGLVTYVAGRLAPQSATRWMGPLTAAWLAVAFGLLLVASDGRILGVGLSGLLAPSSLGVLLGLLATGLGGLAALASTGRIDARGPVRLYYALFLFALAGVVAVGFAEDLFTIFVMVELSAIPSYALVAYRYRDDPRAVSAATTYLLQGVAGTLTALLGVSLLFVVGGSLRIPDLLVNLAAADPGVVAAGAALLFVGYGVKLAIVPMHTWLPDAYTAAPASVTAILAGATKIGALIALFRSLAAIPSGAVPPAELGLIVSLVAVLTMTAGNLLALNQTDLRRLLAYSSIAQMGYLLLGFGIGLQFGVALGFAAGLFFAVAYGLTKGGAFLAADLLAAAAGSPEIERMRGLGARHPVLGVSFALFVFGLIGVPATAGFLGKFLLFQAGMESLALGGVVLALVLAANSALSLGYYVPLLSTLLFGGHGSTSGQATRMPRAASASVVALAAATVVLGFFPQLVLRWIGTGTLTPGGAP
jgi:proton-translocating NADH-quinone oxidoreductase chain N